MRYLISAFALLAVSSSVFAEQVEWNYNGQVKFNGSGCTDSNAMVSAAGPDLSILFSDMVVDLSDPMGSLAGRKNCMFTVPTKIAQGRYIATLEQRVNYGVIKSYDSVASYSVATQIFNKATSPMKKTFNRGAMNVPSTSDVRTDDFKVHAPSWCNTAKNKSMVGLLNVNIVTQASRGSLENSVILGIDGMNFRWEATAGIYACNLPI